MELTYDWKSFQTFFHPRRKAESSGKTQPAFFVVEKNVIVSAFCEYEDMSEWVGSTPDEAAASLSHRELVLYDRSKVDQWMTSALQLPHIQDQIDFFRQESRTQATTRGKASSGCQRHFFLEAIQSWWAKLLPSSYGVYIRLEGPKSRDLFVVIRRGKLESFCEPDLSTLWKERRKNPTDIVKFLSERYLLPVQGLFVNSEDWDHWSEAGHPWALISDAINHERAKLFPKKFVMSGLIKMRATFGL